MTSTELAPDYESLEISSFDFWSLYMHKNQCYLGRTYVLSKRQGQFDMFDISKQEYFELQTIVVAVRNALGNLFSPDLFNYASLGNVFKRLHIHIIPRYKSSRVFCDKVFTDINWGRNYAPYNKNFSVDAEVYDSLKLGFREFGFT